MESLRSNTRAGLLARIAKIDATQGYPNEFADTYAKPDLLDAVAGVTALPIERSKFLARTIAKIEAEETIEEATVTRDSEGKATRIDWAPRLNPDGTPLTR